MDEHKDGIEKRTLADEFTAYHSEVYPHGTTRDQRTQLNDAFVAGAFLVLMAFTDDMGEDETIGLCEAWTAEAEAYAIARGWEPKGEIDDKY